MNQPDGFDPERDLLLQRSVPVRPELVWQAWTTPAHVLKWFTPAPWKTVDCEIDLRPGGRFRTRMRGPDGQEMDVAGCYLEILPHRRLVWTDALAPGFRPAETPFFTAALTFEAQGAGTLYTAHAMHRDPATKQKHAAMGFSQGWSTVLDQLVAMVQAW